jgi:hypothetical protein
MNYAFPPEPDDDTVAADDTEGRMEGALRDIGLAFLAITIVAVLSCALARLL